MPDWDADSDRLCENLIEAYRLSRDEARKRNVPGIDMARTWHSVTMAGLSAPDPDHVGHFRGEAGLEGCEVHIGAHQGTPSVLVADELGKFEARLKDVVAALDTIIPEGSQPQSRDHLNAVIELCAWVHAEWVRIHPFANGNGRTARIWAGHIAMRYGLPPFVRLRPRPDGGYASACSKAMDGDWTPTAAVFRRMYLDLVGSGDTSG